MGKYISRCVWALMVFRELVFGGKNGSVLFHVLSGQSHCCHWQRGKDTFFFDATLRHVYEGKSRIGYIWSGLCSLSAEYSRKLHKMTMSVSAQVFKSTD